jgi:hypothetical protein
MQRDASIACPLLKVGPPQYTFYACPRGALRQAQTELNPCCASRWWPRSPTSVVTFVAGLRAHSLALLSEAGHNASDFLALLLSFVAVYFQIPPRRPSRTFGYQRAGVLAAFINAATLIVIAIWIGIEAIHRLSAPVAVQPRLMMIVAAAGVVMNGVIAALLWGVARDVNLRSAFLHMAGDTLSTAAVIAGGAGILLTGQNWIDPVLSLLIAALILWTSLASSARRSTFCWKARPAASRSTRFAPAWKRSRASSTSTTCTSGASARTPRAGLPRDHRRHSAVGERLHPGQAQPRAQGALPHQPHHHPVRAHGLRGAGRLRRAHGRDDWQPEPTRRSASTLRTASSSSSPSATVGPPSSIPLSAVEFLLPRTNEQHLPLHARRPAAAPAWLLHEPETVYQRTGPPVHHLFHDYQRTEVMIPMRDGVKLHAVILKPADIAAPLPFLIQRTPYGVDGTNRASFFGQPPRAGPRRLHLRRRGHSRPLQERRRVHHEPAAGRSIATPKPSTKAPTPTTPSPGCSRTSPATTAAPASSAPAIPAFWP